MIVAVVLYQGEIRGVFIGRELAQVYLALHPDYEMQEWQVNLWDCMSGVEQARERFKEQGILGKVYRLPNL